MFHVDVKKIGPSGRWRLADPRPRQRQLQAFRQAGYRYIHSAIDDRTRLVYSEIHPDEQAVTAAAFWCRAAGWFASWGISCQ